MGVSGTVNVNSITFGSAQSNPVTLSGGTSITLGGTTPTITVNNAADTISSVLAGSAGLTKTGTGTQTLSGNNSYSGTTVISGGILAIAHNNALGNTTGNTTVTATGSSTGPRLTISGTITSPENISISGTTDGSNWAPVISSTSGTNTLSGTITLASPSNGIRLGANGGDLIFSGTISQTGTTRSLVLQASTGSALTVNNAIANNNGPLSVINSGPVTLKGASTAIGATSISEGGLLKLGVNNAIKTDQNLTIGETWNFTGSDQGTFDLAGFNQTVRALIGNKNTTAGTIGADSTRKVTNSAASGTSTLTVGNGNGTGTFNGVILDGATAKVALTKTGTGTQTLVGESTYSGPTIIGNGTLSLTHLNAMQYSPLDTANSVTGDGTKGLKTNQSSLNLGGLSGSKNLAAVFTTTSGGYGSVSTLTLNTVTGADLTYSGSIANGAAGMALIKTGAGSQTLSGANTYTGATTVNAGTLLINGSTHSGSAVAVNGTATLGGTGIISNSVTVVSGATLQPGATGGTLTVVGSVTIGGTLKITLDGGGSKLAVGGNLDITGATLEVTGSTAGATGVIVEYGSLTGTFGGNLILPPDWNVVYNYQGNKIALWRPTGTTIRFR